MYGVWKMFKKSAKRQSKQAQTHIHTHTPHTHTNIHKYRIPMTYMEAVKTVLEKDGYIGLFGRGLKTRILANGMQGLLFSVLWKSFEEKIFKRQG